MQIYKTTNLINNKIYIGKEQTLRKGYLGSGKLIRRAIAKYGKEHFSKEILEKCTTVKELIDKEIYWINYYNSRDINIGYNITKGGNGGQTVSNERMSEIKKELWKDPNHRKKQSLARKGRINWNAGKIGIYSKEAKIKMSIAKEGKTLPESHKNSIRKANYNRKYVQLKCLETNEIFNSISSAKRWLKTSDSYKLGMVKEFPIIIGNYTWLRLM